MQYEKNVRILRIFRRSGYQGSKLVMMHREPSTQTVHFLVKIRCV